MGMPVKLSDELVKHAEGDLDAAFPRKPARIAVLGLLRTIVRSHDFKASADRAVYQAAENSAIERIEPSGRRTTGRFVNRI